MAFWVLFGKSWYLRKDIPNMISLYKRYLYDEWFNSLTKEEQIIETDRIERKRQEGKEAIMRFLAMGKMISRLAPNYYL